MELRDRLWSRGGETVRKGSKKVVGQYGDPRKWTVVGSRIRKSEQSLEAVARGGCRNYNARAPRPGLVSDRGGRWLRKSEEMLDQSLSSQDRVSGY